MKIIPLSEGSFTVDKTKAFVPFDIANDDLQQRPLGSLLVEVQPFVVVTSKDLLLFDTGLGFGQDGELQLHKNLVDNGIDPDRITKVLLSHLHKDHAGGISTGRGSRQLSFPKAQYYVQKRELNIALEKPSSSFIREEIVPLQNDKQVTLLDEDRGSIGETIRFEVTGAHSPFHQVFWVEESGEAVFFGGDDAPQLQQMRHRFVAKYDFNGKKAMELRKEWWEQGEKEKWTFLFYHDVKNPSFRF